MKQAKLYGVCTDALMVWTDEPDAFATLGKFRHSYKDKPARLLSIAQQRELFEHLEDINADESLYHYRDIARYIEDCVAQGYVVPQRTSLDSMLDGISYHWIWALPTPAFQHATSHNMPGIEEFVKQYTDGYVREQIKDIVPTEGSHPVIQDLYEYSDDIQPYNNVNKAFETWNKNITRVDASYEFVLRLQEPKEEDEWLIECVVRDKNSELHSISENIGDKGILAAGVTGLKQLQKTYRAASDWHSSTDGFSFYCTLKDVEHFVTFGVPALREAGLIVMLPREWVKLTPHMKVNVHTEFEATPYKNLGIEHMANFTWEVALGDMKLTQKEIQEIVRQKSSLVNVRNQWVQLDEKSMKAAAKYIRNNKNQHLSLGEALRSIQGVKDLELLEPEIKADGWIADFLKGTLNERIKRIPQPKTLNAELRHYQRDGLDWLAFMSSLSLGVILADDMGLGKTIQLIALILHEKPRKLGPNLIVCPMSVVGNWESELKKFAPSLSVYVHHGTSRHNNEEFKQAAAAHDIVLTTYSLMARDSETLRTVNWNRVTLDEAQYIKNHTTSQARAARSLKARHRVALTGTPVENKLTELRSIMDFVNPGMFGAKKEFQEQFAKPIERHADQEVLNKLKRFIEPFVLRRAKTDRSIVPELPQKQEITVRTNLTVEQAGLYQATVQDMLTRIDALPAIERKALVLTTLMRLKQICNHPAHFLSDNSAFALKDGSHRSGKVECVEDLVDTIMSEGHKVILFTQYTEFGHLLQPYLEQRFKTKVPFLHGGISKKKRDQMVAEFQKNTQSSPQIMLLSLRAGGIGLNLTAANHVIHIDRWWNPAVENQATDRAFRIGQSKDVQVYKLLTVGTVEERIEQIINSKKDLADMVVSTSQGWITELDTKALRDLFALDLAGVSE
ncbi:MAG: DEAD/DEAH box helicase [Micrococcaceae bacterium]